MYIRIIQGTLASVRTHSLPHEILSAEQITERFPVFKPPSVDTIGILESEAGYLIPEACVEAHFKMAEKYGAELHFEESLVAWEQIRESLFKVTTDLGKVYLSKKLVMSVGPWAPDIYGSSIPIPLHVERRVLFWFKPPIRSDLAEFSKIPIYIWDLGDMGNFYGFPLQGGEPSDAVKVAMHYVDAKVKYSMI